MEYLIVTVLVIFSGIFSGLNIGLLSLNVTELERKIKLGNKDAETILKVRKNGNLLLTVILLGNVAVNSTMAIFLGGISSGIVAGVISTMLIVVFGEIIPQAIFSRYALKYGSKLVWLIQMFTYILYPICKPISFALDKVLGKELPTVWDKSELKEIIKDHEDMSESDVDADEERIVLGALTYSEKKVSDIMTPSSVVFHLNETDIIDKVLIDGINQHGFSRIPIFEEGGTISNILNVKTLLGVELNKFQIKDIKNLGTVVYIEDNAKLDDVFDIIIHNKTQIMVVYDEFGVFLGIVTLEDIIEEILNIEIMDETDIHRDMRILAKQKINKLLKKE